MLHFCLASSDILYHTDQVFYVHFQYSKWIPQKYVFIHVAVNGEYNWEYTVI